MPDFIIISRRSIGYKKLMLTIISHTTLPPFEELITLSIIHDLSDGAQLGAPIVTWKNPEKHKNIRLSQSLSATNIHIEKFPSFTRSNRIHRRLATALQQEKNHDLIANSPIERFFGLGRQPMTDYFSVSSSSKIPRLVRRTPSYFQKEHNTEVNIRTQTIYN